MATTPHHRRSRVAQTSRLTGLGVAVVIPPVAEPPVADPPVVVPDPPVADPPVAEPPVADPPVVVPDPPVADPPVVEPPVVVPDPVPVVTRTSQFAHPEEQVGTDQEVLTWAIEQLNLGLVDGIDFGGRRWMISAELPAIISDNALLRGNGATLVAHHPGRALIFGTPDNVCTRTTVDRLNIDYAVPNDGTSPAVDFASAVHVTWSNSQWLNMGFVARFGDDLTRSQRCVLDHIEITLDEVGAMTDGNIVIRNATSTRLTNVHLNGRFPSAGSIILIQPHLPADTTLPGAPPLPGTSLVDTVWITDSSFQCFAESAIDLADGKDHCLKIDMTNGVTHNVWATNTVFDHAKVAGILVTAPLGTISMGGRFVRIVNCRIDADAGSCIRIDNPAGVIMDGYQVRGNTGWVSAEAPAVAIDDPLLVMRGTIVAENQFLATRDAARSGGVSMNTSRFHVVNNYVGRTTVGGGGWASGVEVLHADADQFVISGNICESGVGVIEPIYTSPSTSRVVIHNLPAAAVTVP